METYQAKNVCKKDIDILVEIIYHKFEDERAKNVDNILHFYYDTPTITLNNVKFYFSILCYYHDKTDNENWNLKFVIRNDEDFDFDEAPATIISDYFHSKTIQELLVKYVNSKFVYDKCDNKIMRYEDYSKEECVRKLFHTNIECCVCYDNLSGVFKTKCGHYLCLDCYTQIKGKKLCPMCKSCLCCGLQENCDD